MCGEDRRIETDRERDRQRERERERESAASCHSIARVHNGVSISPSVVTRSTHIGLWNVT